MPVILARYIRREMAGSFLLSLSVFLFALFANRMLQLLELVFAKGATLKYAAGLLLTMLPAFLVYAMPMSFILALLLAYGRMSADSEIVALRASGVGLWAITRPAFELAVVIAAVSMLLATWAVPWGRHEFSLELYKLASNQVNVGLREAVFNPLGKGLVLYADRVEKGELSGVMLSDARKEKETYQIFAHRGRLHADEGSPILDLDLYDGRILGSSPTTDTVRAVDFERVRLHIDLREGIRARNYYVVNEMTPAQLREELQRRREQKKPLTPVLMEMHKRFTLPIGVLIFPFLGIPLAMTNRRSGRTQGFLTALIVIAGYYMLFTAGQNAAKREQVPVELGLWGANFLLASVAAWFYARTARDRTLFPWRRT